MLTSLLLQSGLTLIENAQLSKYTTFQLGGPCLGLIECHSPEDLITCVKILDQEKQDFILIGGGSNVLVSDQGISSYVIRYFSDQPYIIQKADFVEVSGSTVLDDLAVFCCKNGIKGLNYCSGIPGSVGGAVVGNAGAFGQQVGDVIEEIKLLSPSGKIRSASPKDLDFSYRHSSLKESNEIVLSGVFKLSQGNQQMLENERDEILALRSSKHPDLKVYPCAGSFFRNIEPTSKADKRQAAGWFLEQVGGKTLSCGGAEIFEKHANIIVKGKHCSSEDVFNLHCQMKELVKEKFQIELVREVRFIGPFHHREISAKIW